MRRGSYGRSALVGILAIACALAPAALRADDRLHASGFVGLGWFDDDTELGNSWAPEQVPTTAPVIGARLGYVLGKLAHRDSILGEGATRLALAVEAELAMAAAYTGGDSLGDGDGDGGGGGGRMSYFAPVFGWRAHALLRLGPTTRVAAHLLAGAGGETVASSSPFMSKETDAMFYYGPGLTVPVARRWQLRVDLRHGIMAGRTDATSSLFEVQFGFGATLDAGPRPSGRARVATSRRPAQPPSPESPPPALPPPPPPPSPDADHDGIADARDQCRDVAEDRDAYADHDGCPDLDDDGDSIEDARDKCAREPETRNGLADDDGCPDTIPPAVTKALAAVAAVRFEPAHARVTPAAETTLTALVDVLYERRELRIVIVGRPDRGGADLAKRRAEAVKWYLVDTGVTEDRIDTRVGAPATSPISAELATPK